MKKIDKKIKQLVKVCVEDVFAKGKLNDQKAEQYLKLFKKGSKLETLALLEEFQRQIKRKLTQTTLVIEAATDLSQTELNEIKRKFEERFTINDLKFKKNPLLLGGLRVKIGDYIFDDSLNIKMQEVKTAIVG